MVVGVSGGIDSAVTAALYADILGPGNIILVNMPSKYNSGTTKGLAQQLAQNLKTNYTIIPIQQSVNHTVAQLTENPIHSYAVNRDFRLKLSELNKENIQARDRGARILAAVASAVNGGFSCNTNKAELTVGYGTFYGDIAGVVAPLGDLWKHQVFERAGI
jgi:NAD+ synthase (glutamine-hydrolysing)